MKLKQFIYTGAVAVAVMASQHGAYGQSVENSTATDNSPQTIMQILGVYTPSVSTSTNKHLYLLVDTKDRSLDKLTVTVYDNVNTLVKKSEINLLDQYSPSKGSQIIDFTVNGGYTNQVLQVSYSYTDDTNIVQTPYWHADGSFDYISDMSPSSYRLTAGWGSPSAPNKSFYGDNNGILCIVANPTVNYAKGFGVHAKGSVEIQPEILTPYSRVAVDMGAQVGYGGNTEQTMSYRIESGNMVLKTTQTIDSITGAYVGGDLKKSQYVSWDTPINNSAVLRLIIEKGTDGRDDNDHVCVGAPRLYYTPIEKTSQSISWKSQQRVINNNSTQIELDAQSSTGMPIYYYLVKGSDFATLEGNILKINTIPNGGQEIVVDAYQPGDDAFAPSEVSTCTFSLVRGIEVLKGQYVQIDGPEILDELIIYADKDSSGQLNIKNGIVDVKKIVLKYTFIPGEWTYISFPSDLNIDKISDLNELGYTFNGFSVPSYSIRELNGDAYSTEDEGENLWTFLETPQVKGLKGYTMAIDDSRTDLPVEVTFTIDNEGIDLLGLMRTLGLTVNLTNAEPSSTTKITVSSANPNVTSNNLTIDVEFRPTSLSSLPINHEKALERMRYVFVNGHNAIRLTLPDQTPAKVVFFDSTGSNVIKAVRYIAPNVIDLSDLKSGNYNMVVNYGNATHTYPITLN